MDFDLTITQLILAAGPYTILTEMICQMVLKPLIKKLSLAINPAYLSLLVGIVISATLNIDFATAVIESTLGVTIVAPYIGMLISGVFIGRFANFVHDIWPGNDGRST